MYLAATQLKIDIIEGADAGEGLSDAAHGQLGAGRFAPAALLAHATGAGHFAPATLLAHATGAGRFAPATLLAHATGAGRFAPATLLAHATGAGRFAPAALLAHATGAGRFAPAAPGRKLRLLLGHIDLLMICYTHMDLSTFT